MFKYKGYEYEADEEKFEDNKKILHLVTDTKTGKVEQISFSPYSIMTENTFKMIVDLGFPPRTKDMVVPWNHDTIKKEFLKKDA